MNETIRVFVAIELPEHVKHALAGLIEGLRQEDIRGLRLVRPEGIHLTLKFLGNIPGSQVESIAEAVTWAAREHAPFDLELGDMGVFPNPERPRVLWVGVEGDMESLLSFQKDIDSALEKLGFSRERRGFNPHLTVGRLRDGTSARDRRRAAEALSTYRIEPGPGISVSSVSVMRSTLLPDGAVYECMVSIPLKGGYRNEVK